MSTAPPKNFIKTSGKKLSRPASVIVLKQNLLPGCIKLPITGLPIIGAHRNIDHKPVKTPWNVLSRRLIQKRLNVSYRHLKNDDDCNWLWKNCPKIKGRQ